MSTLLYIEDNSDNAFMLERRLSRRGYTMHVVESGEAGLALAPQILPDLIIVDLLLPGMDGWELAAAFKANPETAHIPILAFSSSAMEADRDRAFASGCDDFEAKPVELPSLLQKIEALIDKNRTTQS